MKTAMIIVAGGKGVRAGGPLPKQYQKVGGQPLFSIALDHAAACAEIDLIQPVIGEDHEDVFGDIVYLASEAVRAKCAAPVTGGATRQASTLAGLTALPESTTHVLIHDAARPFLPAGVVTRLVETIGDGVGAIPVLQVADSVKRLSDGLVIEEPDRTGLARAQTPQGFLKVDLERAFAAAGDTEFTDDAGLARAVGIQIKAVDGDEALFKVTQPEDFAKAEAMIMQQLSDVRTGMGFDVHAFEAGDVVTLCGINVPHNRALKGHSDADVGLHALTDAILGAIGAGDIGDHFPPSDPQWKGAPSDKFLAHAAQLVAQAQGVIGHVDVTLICERPKIGPYRAAMVARVADILGLEQSRVSIKATTTEKLGFTGRQEGIAAQAVATVRLP